VARSGAKPAFAEGAILAETVTVTWPPIAIRLTVVQIRLPLTV